MSTCTHLFLSFLFLFVQAEDGVSNWGQGELEFIGPMEQVDMNIAVLKEDVLPHSKVKVRVGKKKGGGTAEDATAKFKTVVIPDGTTHVEITPMNILSVASSLTPFSDQVGGWMDGWVGGWVCELVYSTHTRCYSRPCTCTLSRLRSPRSLTRSLSRTLSLTRTPQNQSPRNMYQCQMAKQTMGTPLHSHKHRTDNKVYRIQTPQCPLVQNQRQTDYQVGGLD